MVFFSTKWVKCMQKLVFSESLSIFFEKSLVFEAKGCEMFEKVLIFQVFSKSRSIFVKNHLFLRKIVISRSWEKRETTNRQTDALMVWKGWLFWRGWGGGRWLWATNNFVVCRLHHCTYRSEEQEQNDRKLIT